MRDPVILPSSKQTVDRSTIAKHLLSNETDPFTKQPLALSEVTPNKELKDKIIRWEKVKKGIIIEEAEEKIIEALKIDNNNDVEAGCSEAKKPKIEMEKSKITKPKSITGGHSLGGDKLLPRIRKDMKQIMNECPGDIFFHFDEENMTLFHIVIRGPPDTPYQGGYFYFRLHCPPNYPSSPPKAEFMTTDGGRVRFNPNLYMNGKVCLSILGTMTGPGWSPALNMLQVIMTIQSIMVDNPYYNVDPVGTEDQNKLASDEYNVTIVHESIRVAYLDMIASNPSGMPEPLHLKIQEDAPNQLHHHLTSIEKYLPRDGQDMRVTYSEIKGKFNWAALKTKLDTYYSTVLKL